MLYIVSLHLATGVYVESMLVSLNAGCKASSTNFYAFVLSLFHSFLDIYLFTREKETVTYL